MRRWWAAALVVLGVGCAGGGSLPDDGGGTTPPPGNSPATPPSGRDGGGGTPVVEARSLWPLTAGSTWTYRITDTDVGTPFEKRVTVIGEQAVPETGGRATVVVSVQKPSSAMTREEKSWQVVKDGIVLRVREEDRNNGYLVRVTTWDPATVKSLADVPTDPAWAHTAQITEMTRFIATNTAETKGRQYVWRVLSLDEEVTVPAGTFRAVKLHRERTDDDKQGKGRTYWLVPGVGKVREEGERTEELLSFDVKK